MPSRHSRIPTVLDKEIDEVAGYLGIPKRDKHWRSQTMAVIASYSKGYRTAFPFLKAEKKKEK